jgi:hypothetical protein
MIVLVFYSLHNVASAYQTAFVHDGNFDVDDIYATKQAMNPFDVAV